MQLADKSREVWKRSLGDFMEIEVYLISKKQRARREDMAESREGDFGIVFW